MQISAIMTRWCSYSATLPSVTRSSHSLENTNTERNTHLTHNLKQTQTSDEQTNVRANRKRKAASKNTLILSIAWLDATISVWTSLKFCFHFFWSRHFKQYHQTLSPFLPFLVSSLSPPAPRSGWKLWLQLGWSEVMGPPNPITDYVWHFVKYPLLIVGIDSCSGSGKIC